MEHRAMRKYVPPTLVKHDRLAAVTAGPPPVITEQSTAPGKGGCFEAPQKRAPQS